MLHNPFKGKHVPAVPDCVRTAIENYRGENDWLSHFLDDCCEVAEPYTEKSGELYSAYRAFCARTGEYIRSTTDFYKALDQRGFARSRKKNGVLVYGLRLSKEDDLPL